MDNTGKELKSIERRLKRIVKDMKKLNLSAFVTPFAICVHYTDKPPHQDDILIYVDAPNFDGGDW